MKYFDNDSLLRTVSTSMIDRALFIKFLQSRYINGWSQVSNGHFTTGTKVFERLSIPFT